MATNKPDYYAKVKLKTPVMSMDFDGGALGCAIQIAEWLPVEQHEKAIERLTESLMRRRARIEKRANNRDKGVRR